MAKRPPPGSDNSARYAVAVALGVLAVGFIAAWLYLQYKNRMDAEVRYLQLASIAISRDGHSMAATVAIRTSGSDAGWASDHKRALQEVVKQVLMEADPRQRAPAGVLALQERIALASNAALKTERVKEAVITDFLVSEGDL